MSFNCLLAKSLMEWTEDSKTEFIEVSSDKQFETIAERLKLAIPSPDLAFFKTIYARLDVPNRNKVILPRKQAEEGLPTLIGKQINWNHKGAGFICGYILDAQIEEDRIVIYGALFKSRFPKEFEQVKTLFAEGKLAVSYEIWNTDENGESVIKFISNGIKVMTKIEFHGCGLLLNVPPAEPTALVSELLFAMQEEITQEINDKFVYAELAKNCKNCGKCLRGGDEVENNNEQIENKPIEAQAPVKVCAVCSKEYEGDVCPCQKMAVETVKMEEQPQVEAAKKVCPTCNQEHDGEDVECGVCKKKKLEQAQEMEAIPAPTCIRRTVEEKRIVVEENGIISERGIKTIICDMSDGTQSSESSEFAFETIYTQAQLDESIKAIEEKYKKDIEVLNASILNLKSDIEQKEVIIASTIKEESDKSKTDAHLEVGEVFDLNALDDKVKRVDKYAWSKTKTKK